MRRYLSIRMCETIAASTLRDSRVFGGRAVGTWRRSTGATRISGRVFEFNKNRDGRDNQSAALKILAVGYKRRRRIVLQRLRSLEVRQSSGGKLIRQNSGDGLLNRMAA